MQGQLGRIDEDIVNDVGLLKEEEVEVERGEKEKERRGVDGRRGLLAVWGEIEKGFKKKDKKELF